MLAPPCAKCCCTWKRKPCLTPLRQVLLHLEAQARCPATRGAVIKWKRSCSPTVGRLWSKPHAAVLSHHGPWVHLPREAGPTCTPSAPRQPAPSACCWRVVACARACMGAARRGRWTLHVRGGQGHASWPGPRALAAPGACQPACSRGPRVLQRGGLHVQLRTCSTHSFESPHVQHALF